MRKLKLLKRLLVAGMALCVFGLAAQAQKLPTATAPGAYLAVGGTYSGFEAQYPQRLLGGAGVYADLNIRRHLGIEGEVRFLRQNQIFGSHETTYMGGPRYEFHSGRYSPYLKALIGGGRLVLPTVNGFATGYGTYTALAFGGGLDVNLTSKIKVRAFDFEYQDWPNFYIPGGPQQALTPYGVSAGLSYQVYHTGGWRKHRYK